MSHTVTEPWSRVLASVPPWLFWWHLQCTQRTGGNARSHPCSTVCPYLFWLQAWLFSGPLVRILVLEMRSCQQQWSGRQRNRWVLSTAACVSFRDFHSGEAGILDFTTEFHDEAVWSWAGWSLLKRNLSIDLSPGLIESEVLRKRILCTQVSKVVEIEANRPWFTSSSFRTNFISLGFSSAVGICVGV